MPLSRSLLQWVRALFTGRSRAVQIVLGAVLVLVGWVFVLFALMATAIADFMGAIGPTRSMHPALRISAGVVALLVLGTASSTPAPGNDSVAQVPTPVPTELPSDAPAPESPVATATAPPTASPTVAPTATATSTPAPTPAPTGSPLSTSITATDLRGDQFDENDEPVDGVDYQDIVAASAEWQDLRLRLVLDVATAPPRVDPLREVITFAWQLDTTMDGLPDWLLIVENLEEPGAENAPGWSAGLTRMSDGQTLGGPEFPGTLRVDGARVTATTDLYARTDRVGVAATTEHTVWTSATEALTIYDDLPQEQFPNGNDWLVIGTP